MISIILDRLNIDQEKQVNEITKEERNKIVKTLKNLELNISGTRGIEEAIITSGGINIKEINPKTMESKIIKGLYFAGEIIDVDAYTGGFNLQIAYSTGYTAGLISRFRPKVHIIGATPKEKVYRQLDMLWGVRPVLTPVYNTTDEMFDIANETAKKNKFVVSGDNMVVTCGTPHINGGTNLMKIVKVK